MTGPALPVILYSFNGDPICTRCGNNLPGHAAGCDAIHALSQSPLPNFLKASQGVGPKTADACTRTQALLKEIERLGYSAANDRCTSLCWELEREVECLKRDKALLQQEIADLHETPEL